MIENYTKIHIQESNNNSSSVDNSQVVEIAFYFSFFLIVSSLFKVVCNGCLLLVLYKDPCKTLRTPSTVFIGNLSLTGIGAGMTYEPVLAILGVLRYKMFCNDQLQTVVLSTAAILWKNSILTVLAFTVVQLIAVASPLKHAKKITSKKVLTANVMILVYSVTSSAIFQYSGWWLRQIFRCLHYILFPTATLVIYVILYRAYKHQISQGSSLGCESGDELQGWIKKRFRQQQYMTFNLILVLTTFIGTQAATVPSLIYDLHEYQESIMALYLALSMTGFLSLKLVFDTILFAWRFPQYREALRALLQK